MKNKIVSLELADNHRENVISLQLGNLTITDFGLIRQLTLSTGRDLFIYSFKASKHLQNSFKNYYVSTMADGKIILGCYLDIDIKNHQAFVKYYKEDCPHFEVLKSLRGQGVFSAVLEDLRKFAENMHLTLVIEEVVNQQLAEKLLKIGFKKIRDPMSLSMPDCEPIYNYIASPKIKM